MNFIKQDIKNILEDINALKTECKIEEKNTKFDKIYKQVKDLEINFTLRNIAKRNYDKVRKVFSLISSQNGVSEEVLKLLSDAKNKAELELPTDIEEYTKELYEKAFELFECYENKCFDKRIELKKELRLHLEKAIEQYKIYIKLAMLKRMSLFP